MQIRVGCEIRYEVTWPTPTIIQVQPRADVAHHVLQETWEISPHVTLHAYRDIYKNVCQRLVMPVGEQVLRYDAFVEDSGGPDEVDPGAVQMPIEALPDDVLHYTLPSRYCVSDVLSDTAWQLFGAIDGGWVRVQAICDWVHSNIRFQYGTSTPQTTAADVFERRIGVCRDFAHLAVTFCRALNIPARYVFGYLPDIGVPPPYEPMDFCAWMEVYLADRWWTFDPRNNMARIGRVLIGRGRDALDVAMVTTYGSPRLQSMSVWADEVPAESVATAPSIIVKTGEEPAGREDDIQA